MSDIDEQVEEAERAVEEAEQALDRAEVADHATGTRAASAALQDARYRASTARENLRRLRTRRAAQRYAEQTRATAEAAVADRLPDMVQRLSTARAEAADALADAQRAAGRLLDACAAYDALVRSTAADLRAAGLRGDDGEPLGGTAAGAARIGGGEYLPADGPALLGHLVAVAVGARHRGHPLAVGRWRHVGGMATVRGRGVLLGMAGGGERGAA